MRLRDRLATSAGLDMLWRLAIGVIFLLLAIPEFFHAGPAAGELVRRPGRLMDALLSGDQSVGPWLLLAYGVLMLVRAWAHRPLRPPRER